MNEVTNVETTLSIWQLVEYCILFVIFLAQCFICYMVLKRTRQIGGFLPESKGYDEQLVLEKELTPEAKSEKSKEMALRSRKEKEMEK